MKLVAKAVESIGKQAPPVVNVEAPVVNVAAPAPAKKGKRKGKITGPDGRAFTVETED